ncbi:MAG TPA: gamma-glutamyltransferase, partial [Burkholderiaceae bacterium]|nr:gamma-glutamyltransferase [Burkholderiaceae bacterium]
DFYRGQTAARIAAAAAQAGAALDAADLAAHRADWTTLLHADFRGGRLYEMPPNGQGVLALFALSVLQRHDLQRHRLDGAQSLHLQIEAIKVAFAELVPHLGDPDAMRHDVRQLLSPQRIAQAAARIDPDRASDYGHRLVPLAGTVYLAAGDRDGMMVSLIQSNYMGFGSGVVVPGTGVALQNRGACFATDADAVAAIAPGRRPFHTILPGFLDGDGVAAAFGATGGAFQPQGHVQLVVRLHPYAQPPQAAIDAPRFKIGAGRSVVLEPGFADATVQGLRQLGHDVTSQLRSSWDFGGMQMLQRRADCYWGACDWRRDSYIAVG